MSLTIEEIEERRAALREENAAAQAKQHATDMAAVLDLEERHGFASIEVMPLARWSPGAASLVAAEVPRAADNRFKRYQQVVNSDKAKAAAKVDAAEQFARSCTVYPSPKDDPELFEATVDAAPGILGHVALQLVRAVQGRETDEGK